ncbi:hypothetical protein EDE15_1049 [Edaphobacter aggregans]|uniref:Uncharacterized protein n=1 Tax=Edaphobacter aggregans TaxID=570835 RepID=A0A428MF74_9BACT|nr:hypothetical protein [Edaphobacter aggregans]RSL15558.1 hypothetical protein EDE15_1049 [Edaphobacter aggregans]
MNKKRHEKHHEGHPQQPGTRANSVQEPLMKIPNPLPVQIESSSKGNERYDEEKKNRETTLRTAKHLNWITGVAAAISLLALVALYMSISVSRTQARIAQQEFEMSQRPWVGLADPITISKLVDDPRGSMDIEITAKVKNFGNSPAFNVVPALDLVIGNGGTDIRPAIDKVCARLEGDIMPLKVGDIVFPGDSYSFPTEAYRRLDEGQADPVYFFPGCILYIDRDKKIKHTKICQWTDNEHLKVGASLSSCSRQSAD